MIEQVRTQIQVLRVKLDSDLFVLYERNNLIEKENENSLPSSSNIDNDLYNHKYNLITINEKMYRLTNQAKLEITSTEGNIYQINTESTENLAKIFLYQNFKKNLDNIIERGLFSAYLYIALTEFFIINNNIEQVLHCLCIANITYGSTLTIKNKIISLEIGKVSTSESNSKNAKIKAKKYAENRAPTLRKLESLWDEDNWTSKGRGKYEKFATQIIYHDQVEGIGFDSIKKYISKYDKTKNKKT